MKVYWLTLLALSAGCAAPSTDGPDAAAGYRGIEEVRILAKGME